MVVTATGWTFDYINSVPMIMILELLNYWEEYPPPHILQRAGVRIQSRRKRGPRGNEQEQVVQSMGILPDERLPLWVQEARGDLKKAKQNG